MKKYIIALLILVSGLSACKKSATFDPAKQAIEDDATIQAYLKANPSITATKDASGLYYQIITPGTGNNPTGSSTVTVNYTGKLLDGTTFDTTTGKKSLTISLKSVIQGWTIGVPLIKTGGRILLIIPSGLAYGNSSAGSIPANTVLTFTIDLISFS
ncbi:FKBP-type peptidyl-prolyl cis-trans isomerase [Mucilaginibacter paludis]|uniref:Peptidyl-prolyl cis-trans isomerase n=1 Tax=Mucilaginibacter paludis DSM 18603 TaxID=714943 RepID=H1Y4R1_9SPHI|nr:FKBP-type peptidyl-prolyl cis-trans isomerase [Mucilaginibacter paludis]EHQ28105.1 peptidylprolyl isomerase FKBP-type [Mucilaginibacter paludis DSM 18603]